MTILEIYDHLKARGYVVDQYMFDRNWMGRREGYLAYVKSTGADPSIESLFKLHIRLLRAEAMEARFDVNTGHLRELANRVMAEIERRC